MDSNASTSGRGDPYWYEWFVGLIEVVDLLDPGGDIASVAFQVPGVKGWDDVIVLLKSGKRRCYQVKHTRIDRNLTFGSLVEKKAGEGSLLRTLFDAWREAGLNDGSTKCILHTNREAGRRWSSPDDGPRRPPLTDFYAWLQESLKSAKSLAEIVPSSDLKEAWDVWLAELNTGSEAERFEFLRALEIRDTEPHLEGVVARVHEKLAAALGVSHERAAPFMDALHRALRKWTTGHPGVTVEELCSELTLPVEEKDRAPAPPPPTPFFPSRVPMAEELERTLKSPSTEPVVLLAAEPGAGKTSVISWMANRRIDAPFTGIVDARFFCFEPIRPENPVVAPDASRVHPIDLWYSFLSQIREGLRGRLHALRVPLRNSMLTWQEAREHVLRLTDFLGKEHGQRFLLAIDGIDHAARAAQTNPQQAADFFASLPGPDELASKNVRLFVAGQLPENYEQYPAWLRLPHSLVKRIDLPLLSAGDVEALYTAANVQFPPDQRDAAIRVVVDNAKGNTLATVFAVDEAQRATSVDELATRLRARRLADGLLTYYLSIWTHMLEAAGDSAAGVEPCLAGAISLARRGIQAELLSTAFAEWKEPTPWWRSILESLGPLLSVGSDGFRVRHNDVRVFLSARFASFSEAQRKRVSSQLADYFMMPQSDRVAAHLQLFDLLRLADRSPERADVFNVEWVFEGAALGVETDQLVVECKSAIQALARRKQWPLVVSVGCATQTLERLARFREYSDAAVENIHGGLPPFLPSEICVRPLKQWLTTDFSTLTRDANRLLHGGEPARALALLQRWLGGLTLSQLVDVFPDTIQHFGSHHDAIKPMDQTRIVPFKDLGALCGTLQWALPHGNPKSKNQRNAVHAFEDGYVKSLGHLGIVSALEALLEPYWPHFMTSWEDLIRRLADTGRWQIVREALGKLSDHRSKLTSTGQAEATWWALRSKAADDDTGWLAPLQKSGFGISEAERSSFGADGRDRLLRASVGIARAIGWSRTGVEPGDIGTAVYDAYEPSGNLAEHRPAGILVFRAAAMLGRIALALATDGTEVAREMVPASDVRMVLSTLWSDAEFKDLYFAHVASDLAGELVDASGLIGGDHAVAARDAARPYAGAFPADFRKTGIWSALQKSSDERDLLKKWLRSWLAEDGKIWSLSRDEVYSITDDFAPLADAIGEHELITRAQERRKWMLIGYQSHKEYGFEYVLDWFRLAVRQSPQVWKDAGWKLWCVCLACSEQGGDNRIRPEIQDEISAAAIRCGPSDWWRLISTTLADVPDESWHSAICYRLVDGAELAVREGLILPIDEMLNLWGLAVSFSFWTEDGDNASLAALCNAMLGSIPTPTRERVETQLRQLTPRVFCRRPSRKQVDETDEGKARGHDGETLETALEKIDRGEQINLGSAAAAIKEIREKHSGNEVLALRILQAIGTGKEYVTAWYFAESYTDDSLRSIAANVNDEQLWGLIDVVGLALDFQSSWLPVFSNLLQLAAARAHHRDAKETLTGLEIQMQMHMAWAFGVGPCKRSIRPLPEADAGLSWQDVALRFLGVLCDSYSAEVLGAALEGMHALVAVDGRIIPKLFTTLNSKWARRWLLSASESWAALHPEAMKAVRDELEREMKDGDLEGRLQLWIVLCRHADALKIPRPAFPIPAKAVGNSATVVTRRQRIMHSSPMMHGHSQLVDRHASAAGKLRRLDDCGYDFSSIESRIAMALNEKSGEQLEDPRKNGARRRGTMLCSRLDEDIIFGQAVLTAINAEWCEQNDLVRIAQAYLNNEDAWIQRRPPEPTSDASGWPDIPEYGPERKDDDAVKAEMINLAMKHDIPEGWRTFSARVIDFTWSKDYVLRLWFEQVPSTLVLRPQKLPTCPSGRTFLWWLGDYFEPNTDGLFVSGFFAGGMCRLHHCNVEIIPPTFWKESMSWEPMVTDPLTWCCKGEPIAIYQRLHGVLRGNPHTTKARQPILHRWLIKKEAFEEFERIFGGLRRREHFETFPFHS